jgi:3-oxoacyl-[acyl-carrier protein] reductase
MIMLRAERVALVNGASRGLGAVIARHLAGVGWTVAVGYRSDEASAERVVADIVASGGMARAYGGDVTDEAAVRGVVDQISTDLGPVLGVVANATGQQPVTPLDTLTWQDHLDQLEYFLKSPTLLVQAALPSMRAHHFGRVIMIGSDMVDRAKPGWTAYSAAKAAQLGLVRVWARELGPDAITVNIVAPGWIPVERHVGADTSAYLAEVPLGRMGTPQDIADTVGYLCSDAAGFVTAQRITVNGSHTISP